jgi:uncharacterized protein YxjI
MKKKNRPDEQRFCIFCGEPVIFDDEVNDYYCPHCYSYQTLKRRPRPIKHEPGESPTPSKRKKYDPPPTEPPRLSYTRRKNIPIFRHRQYHVVQKFFSFAPKFYIYNISGQLMGYCEGRLFSMGGEFAFYDISDRVIATIRGNIVCFSFLQPKEFEIRDQHGRFRGAICSTVSLFRRYWELYDANHRLIGRPDEQVFLKTDWNMTNNRGNVLLSVKRKLWTLKDQFMVTVSESIDPLIALAFAISIDYALAQDSD